MTGWNVEDQPAYRFTGNGTRKPWRDEDVAMSQPEYVARGLDEAGARAALAGRLRHSATLTFLQTSGEFTLYLNAAKEVEGGANMVRMFGRVYRIVNSDDCPVAQEGRLWSHGDCHICTPPEYTHYWSQRDTNGTYDLITTTVKAKD